MKQISDMALRKIKPTDKRQEISLGSSLYFFVYPISRKNPNGRKTFYFRYTAEKKVSWLMLGDYPELSLAGAMVELENKKKLTKQVGNLAIAKKQEAKKQKQDTIAKEKSNFSTLLAEFVQAKVDFKEWTEPHRIRQEMRINKHISPYFVDISVNDIKIEDIHTCLQKIVSSSNFETAKKIYRIIRGVFEYADDKKLLHDISIITRLQRFAKTLPKPEGKTRYQPMTDVEIGEFMIKLRDYNLGCLQVKTAAKIAPLLVLRPKEICRLEWHNIDFEKKTITVPIKNMKATNAKEKQKFHIVPLSRQALELLQALPKDSNFLFCSPRNKAKHITTAAINNVWRSLGYKSALSNEKEFCTHAVRGMFSTFLHEKNAYSSDIIEFQLAHVEKNIVKDKYNRTTPWSYLAERHKMMQDYADFLDKLRIEAQK